MAFCVTRSQFAAGWFGSGNRHRFEVMAAGSARPMGILAFVAGEPVGCVVGHAPKTKASGSCLASSSGQGGRGQRITYALVRAAVELARREGASAIEGWSLARSDRQSAAAFLGREKVFGELGLRSVERPSPQRVIMRLDLRDFG
jgi:hypothetical protein